MFDINDNEKIKRYINKRKDDMIIIPMYVSLYNERYDICELDKITEYSPSALKVGFGSCMSVIEKNPFPRGYMYLVDIQTIFKEFDEVKNIDISYITFESSTVSGDNKICKEINYYFEIIEEYIREHVKEYKKKLVENME